MLLNSARNSIIKTFVKSLSAKAHYRCIFVVAVVYRGIFFRLDIFRMAFIVFFTYYVSSLIRFLFFLANSWKFLIFIGKKLSVESILNNFIYSSPVASLKTNDRAIFCIKCWQKHRTKLFFGSNTKTFLLNFYFQIIACVIWKFTISVTVTT